MLGAGQACGFRLHRTWQLNLCNRPGWGLTSPMARRNEYAQLAHREGGAGEPVLRGDTCLGCCAGAWRGR